MKTIMMISASILALSFAACNSTGSKPTNNADSTQVSATSPVEATNTKPADGILTGYINLKNSLAADNGTDAAKKGQQILDAVSKFDSSSLTPEQKKTFLDLIGDIKENSQHISVNGDRIHHQREHFEMLSEDMTDLIKAVGTGKTLYLDSCSMYDNGRGTWLSEFKEIKNPYFGKKWIPVEL